MYKTCFFQLVFMGSLVLFSNAAFSEFNYHAYQRSTLQVIEDRHQDLLGPPEEFDNPLYRNISGVLFKYSVPAVYTGQARALDKNRDRMIKHWGKSLGIPNESVKLYNTELLFKVNNESVWIPVQTQLIKFLKDEAKAGALIELYIIVIGAVEGKLVYLISEFKSNVYPSLDGVEIPKNRMVFKNAALTCNGSSKDFKACLSIAGLQVGTKFKSFAKRFGKPQQEQTLLDKTIASVYPIVANEQYTAYWVIGHKANKIEFIQLTGNYPEPKLNFSGIRLGDEASKVDRLLGPGYGVKQVKEISGVLRSYRPVPLSIELVEGKVYSIRLSEEPM